MFWQAEVLVATLRIPLFGKQIQRDWEHFLPQPESSALSACLQRERATLAKGLP